MEQGEKRVRSFAESVLFYLGIPVAALYPLGVAGVGIQLWRDPMFPYSRLDTVWVAVSLVPERVVIGTGIRLLFLALVSVAFAVGVSVLLVRGLLLLGREPAEASAVGKGEPRLWMLYLLLLMPLSVVVLWKSVRVSNATELVLFVGFFAFSAAAGMVFGWVRWASTAERFYLTMVAAYLGGVAAAVCLAATQTPPLPLVELRAEKHATLACKEVPAKEMFVMLDRGGLLPVPLQQRGRLAQPAGGRGWHRAFQGVPGLPGQGLTRSEVSEVGVASVLCGGRPRPYSPTSWKGYSPKLDFVLTAF